MIKAHQGRAITPPSPFGLALTGVGLGFGLIGFGLLLNVSRVAVQSSPGPLRIFGDPPLALAIHSPTVWIVPFCVDGVLFGHVVLFRRLLSDAVAQRGNSW